ncbi:MAG: L-cystine transport system permease protein YecS [Paracidovorax wautersii]|uniref:L-cystine transport system permease protein YecS n=1 Tax=Paracidovorax wautersii TaxID=1177982 RepID=A0A7V8FN47_9BURK|nr:MAG: L-cystine transport system permease protein YecS [Paracidovorax wautersii]
MAYQFQFAPVLAHTGPLVEGALLTIELSAGAIVLGTAIGIAASAARWILGGRVRTLIDIYVEVVRNTPFLVQLFILFFGLPALHIRVTATEAALIGMVINLGAYSTEILRAGIDATHRSQIEAGASLGMTPLQIFRHIVLKPAIAKVYPALSSQFVLMMLASSVTSAISTQELSSIAAQIDSETYRSFEVYILVTLLYLGLALLFKGVLALIAKWVFARRRQVPVGARPAAIATREVTP